MVLEFTKFTTNNTCPKIISFSFTGDTVRKGTLLFEQLITGREIVGEVTTVEVINFSLETKIAVARVNDICWGRIQLGCLTGIVQPELGNLILTHPICLRRTGFREAADLSIGPTPGMQIFVTGGQVLQYSNVSPGWVHSVAQLPENIILPESTFLVVEQERPRHIRLED